MNKSHPDTTRELIQQWIEISFIQGSTNKNNQHRERLPKRAGKQEIQHHYHHAGLQSEITTFGQTLSF